MKKNVLLTIGLTVISIVVAALSGGVYAMAIVGIDIDNPATTQDADEDSMILDIDVKKVITDVGRKQFLLTTFLDHLGLHDTVSSEKVVGYMVGEEDMEDTINTDIPADNLTNGILSSSIELANPAMWSEKDVMLFPPSIEGANGEALMGWVETKVGNTISVRAVNPVKTGTTESIPLIPAGTKVFRTGKAMNAIDAKSKGSVLAPVPNENYVQLFMKTIEIEERLLLHKKKADWDLKRIVENRLREFKKEQELAMLLPQTANMRNDSNGKRFYTTAGAYSLAKNYYSLSSWNNQNYINMCRHIFENSGYGSGEKVLFCGNIFRANLASNVDAYSKNFNQTNTEVDLGIKVKKIETDFGYLMPKTHPLLTGIYANTAIAIDLEYARKCIFNGEQFKVETQNARATGEGRFIRKTISETSCLMFDDPYAHAVIYGV